MHQLYDMIAFTKYLYNSTLLQFLKSNPHNSKIVDLEIFQISVHYKITHKIN